MNRLMLVALTACAMFTSHLVVGVAPAQGASLGRAVAKEAGKRVVTRLGAIRQKLGPLHTLEKPQIVERFTNSPKTDVLRGLPKEPNSNHVFVRRIHPGRKGSAEHIQRSLNIRHPIKQRETIALPAGTRYHERPSKGGQKYRREMIVEGRVPRPQITIQKPLQRAR